MTKYLEITIKKTKKLYILLCLTPTVDNFFILQILNLDSAIMLKINFPTRYMS